MTSESPVDVVSTPPSSGLSTGTILLIAAWTILVSALSSYMVWRSMKAEMATQFSLRPQIAVVDSFGWIKDAGQGATIEAKYADGARRLSRATKRLRAKGVLVLDASAVRGAPDAVRVKTPVFHPVDETNP